MRRWLIRIALALVALAGVLTLAVLVILPTEWFRNKVRDRIVSEVERASGGRTEIGAFDFDWKTLTAEVRSFVLHGTEPAGQNPLVRIESLKVGIKIISLVRKKVDIASLELDHPEMNILVDKEGRTNFPSPKVKRDPKDPIQLILDLAVKRISIRRGFVHYSDRILPIDINGEQFAAALSYDFQGPKYTGDVSFEKLTVNTDKTLPVAFRVTSKVTLIPDEIQVNSARLETPKSTVEATGGIKHLRHPDVLFHVKSNADVTEFIKPLRIPSVYAGNARFDGTVSYSSAERFLMRGSVVAHQVSLRESTVHIRNASATANLTLTPDGVQLREVQAQMLGGSFRGNVNVPKFDRFEVAGDVSGFLISELAAQANLTNVPWSGTVTGPVEATGSIRRNVPDFKFNGSVAVEPVSGGIPITGNATVAYDRRTGSIQFGDTDLRTPASRLQAKGALGERLEVEAESRDLNDVLPALRLAGEEPPKSLPLKLVEGGLVRFKGTVTGPIQTAQVAGKLSLTNAMVQDQKIDQAEAEISVDREHIQLSSLALGQGQLRLSGAASLGLQNWKSTDSSPISGNLQLENASLAKLLPGRQIEGTVHATFALKGTQAEPAANANVIIDKPILYGEHFDRFRAEIRYGGAGVEVINGSLEEGSARILLGGAFQHAVGDYKNGTFRFDAVSRNVQIQQFEYVHSQKPDLQARVTVKLSGRGEVKNMVPLLQALDGQAAVESVSLDGRAIGNFSLDATTNGNSLIVGAAGDVRGAPIKGNGTFQLSGDYQGKGRLNFEPLSIAALRDLAPIQQTGPLPFDGIVAGHVTFEGPARKPELMTARVELPKLEIFSTRKTTTRQQNMDLSLRNAKAIVVRADGKGIHVESAQFVGPDTNLAFTGTVALQNTGNWDLAIKGSVNLAVLQNFEPDLVSSGISTMDASIRGTLRRPTLNGQMELKNASFYLQDIPNGIDKANGTIRFDQNRATIVDRLRAQTGGGDIALAGFIGYGASEINYNLQAQADNVRVRYPEGVSTTMNATLTFSGTSQHSLLSGLVTVRRAGFNPRTDLGSLLAATAKPVSTPTTPNEFLRGVQFDVRLESAPNLQFQTTLTNNLQAEADLRLRGSAVRPELGGHIAVNQGDIQFFGNKYTINRGDIYFYNPAKIEPVLDMDVQTTIRGIVVNINFQGPLSKLNVAYRSDPPLQSSEIIALLTVGRTPGNTSSLAASQTTAPQGALATGGNTLLGQAISAPVSSRLQRFFGVSRLKIDPLLTGVTAIPQARLTVEQQISKDVTLTYITNLTQANQQLVRVEWNLNRNWSVIAIREESGSFGIDFLYKARLK